MLRRGKMPRPLFGTEPRNLADIVGGAFQKRGSRSKKQQWQRINEEGVSLRGAQATKQSRSKRLLRSARNDTFSSLGCRHHLGEYLFSGMHPIDIWFVKGYHSIRPVWLARALEGKDFSRRVSVQWGIKKNEKGNQE